MKRKKFSIVEFKFTARELQIAPLIAKGTSRKMMCDKLKITIHTLDVHLLNIRRKIGAESLYCAGCILSHYYFEKLSKKNCD